MRSNHTDNNQQSQLALLQVIRELVDAKLIERGLEQARKMHTRLGVPLYDVEQMIMHPNKENANVPHGPEATNLTLAESIKKEYGLLNVFSPEVGDAHMRGAIHLHDLGFIDRTGSITRCPLNFHLIRVRVFSSGSPPE